LPHSQTDLKSWHATKPVDCKGYRPKNYFRVTVNTVARLMGIEFGPLSSTKFCNITQYLTSIQKPTWRFPVQSKQRRLPRSAKMTVTLFPKSTFTDQ